jgi:hypothetical protein
MECVSRPILALLAFVALLLAPAAHAQDPEATRTVKVEPMEVDGELGARIGGKNGELTPKLKQSLESSIEQGLSRSSVAIAEDAPLTLQTKIIVKDPDYLVTMTLVDAAGEAVTSDEKTCDLCGTAELSELLADVAASVGRKLITTGNVVPLLHVESVPEGAEVFVDGERVGVTPLEVEVETGDSEVEIRKPGYAPVHHQLSFREGVRESLSVHLSEDRPDNRARIFNVLGWTGVGVGAGAIGAGVALIVIHDRPINFDCDGGNKDVDGDCKFIHKTLPGGIVLAAGGAALVGTGIALLVLGKKRQTKPPVEAMVGPGMLGLRGRF